MVSSLCSFGWQGDDGLIIRMGRTWGEWIAMVEMAQFRMDLELVVLNALRHTIFGACKKGPL